jgi:ribose 5-phosphate isomerase A
VATSDTSDGKLRAAQAAAALVQSGMTVGLGSGTTATLVIRSLGARVRDEGLAIVGVPTSEETACLAREVRIPLRDVDDIATLDLDIDGADEVDPEFRMIKGRGGALLREKIVACAARRRVIVVTPEKRVERLGAYAPVPVEVCPVGTRHIEARLRQFGASTSLRLRPDGQPYQTDGGNKIIDCRFPHIDDPYDLDTALQRVVGVYETGLFLGLCDVLIVGHPDRVEQVTGPPPDSRSSCR